MEEERTILKKSEINNKLVKKKNQNLKAIFKNNIKKGLYYEFYWSVIYFSIQFFCFFYKSSILFYPDFTLGPEISILIFVLIINFTKIKIGRIGVEQESKKNLGIFLVLSFPLIMSRIFYLFLQTYLLYKKIKD